jgi:hypothetical protein
MPRAADSASSVENDALPMLSLIGFIMTTYPFATAALLLTTDAARQRFAFAVQNNTICRPENLAHDIEAGRARNRKR